MKITSRFNGSIYGHSHAFFCCSRWLLT